MNEPQDYITTRQAAKLMGVSPETVIRWILHDGLAALRVRCRGGQWRYRVLRRACLERLERVKGCARIEVRAEVPMDPQTRAILEKHGLLKYCPGEK